MSTPSKKPKPKLEIAHQIPGRIRMKVPSAKGNPEQLESYKEILGAIPGIESIDVNPETGSIVLRYDPKAQDHFHAGFQQHMHEQHGQHHRPPKNEIDQLATTIEREAEYLAEHSHVARVFVEACRNADRNIKLHSHNMLDLKMLLAIGVIGITVFEVGAAAATPVWVTLALFGLNHFIEMQEEAAEQRATVRAAAPA
jgi:Heavy metal associated domain 2